MNGKARGIKIVIGNRVHIGAGCVIAPSEEHVQDGILVIGDGAYINPGSTVVKVSPVRIRVCRLTFSAGFLSTVTGF